MKKKVCMGMCMMVVLVWTMLPFYWFLKMAFEIPADVARFPPSFYPRHPTIASLATVLGFKFVSKDGTVYLPSGRARQVRVGLLNSLILSCSVTAITMLVVIPLAYTFGRLEFSHKNKLIFAILFAAALPPISILIPFYMIFIKLGLAGTMVGLIIVTLTITIPLLTWMLIGYFRNLPKVEPLARIDGFSRLKTMIFVIIPMAKVGISVGATICFLTAWNEFTFAQILVNGTPAATVPPVISGFLFMHPEVTQLAATVLYTLIPPFLVGYWLQKYITQMNITEPIER